MWTSSKAVESWGYPQGSTRGPAHACPCDDGMYRLQCSLTVAVESSYVLLSVQRSRENTSILQTRTRVFCLGCWYERSRDTRAHRYVTRHDSLETLHMKYM